MSSTMKWALGIAIFLSAMSFLVGIGSQLTDLGFTQLQVKAIIAIFVILLGLGNSINSVLIAFGFTNASKVAAANTLPVAQRVDIANTLPPAAKLDLAAAVPGVQTITTTKALADSTASDKVQSP